MCPCPELLENFPVILILSFFASFVVSISLMICLRRRRKRVVIVLMFAFAVALVALHAKTMIPGCFFMLIFAVWILGLSDTDKNLHEDLLEYSSVLLPVPRYDFI